MSLEQAATGQIIKNFTNSLLYKLAKFSHRRNIDVDDENYRNIVIRSGWGYLTGEDDHEIIFLVGFEFVYDEAPLVFVSSGFTRPVSEGAPTKLEDMHWCNTITTTEKVICAWDDRFEVYLMSRPGTLLPASIYYGIEWVAIGKKT